MLLLITISTFFTVFLLCILIYNQFIAEKKVMQQRITQFVEPRPEVFAADITKAETNLQGVSWRSLLRSLGVLFDSPRWTRFLEHKLIQAGIPLRSSEYAVILSASMLLFAASAFFVAGKSIAAICAGAGTGYILPMFFLQLKIQQRARRFNNQLSDTLVLIANALRTGYSFMQAVEMVSREMPPPISVEFSRALKEMNLGVSTEDALNNMAKRVDSEDLDLIVTVVLIQRQVGGNLAEILDNIASTVRERVKIRGHIKTLTAQGRVSGLVVGGIPFILAIIIYIINPEYMGLLFFTPLGKMMLGAAIFSQILGALAIRHIINIDI